MRRFYAPKENLDDQKIVLDSEQSRHLQKVLRLTIGDEVRVFDGQGNEFLSEIEKLENRQTVLKIVEQIPSSSSESDLDLTLAVSLLKGDKFDLAIQKSVELGVTKFIPIITRRCDVKLKKAERKMQRWQKIIIESSKQCGRAKLMKINEPIEFEGFVKFAEGTKVLFSEQNGDDFSKIKPTKKITAVIGSEGGWEDSEIEFAKRNEFQIITLRGRILRAETATIAVAAILQNRFGDLN